MSINTACRDPIFGVIKGSALNQNGHSHSIAAPSGDSQVSLIRDALNVAKLSPNDISYVEVHGSATPLGDAIEIESIIKVHKI